MIGSVELRNIPQPNSDKDKKVLSVQLRNFAYDSDKDVECYVKCYMSPAGAGR
jgi:hypothetical protein